MRKLFLLAALWVSLGAYSQLTVFEKGQVRVGNYTTKGGSTATLDISDKYENSKPISGNNAFGSISLGASDNVKIWGNGKQGMLSLYGSTSLSLGVGSVSDAVLLNGAFNQFASAFEVTAPSFLTASDARLKTNVESLNESFLKLKDVNAVSYNLTPHLLSDALIGDRKESETKSEVKDNRLHFGFIAQEIQKLYPNLVVENEDGILAIDYTGFIPLLVEAYKDLLGKVKEQEDIIYTLSNQRGPSLMPASVNGVIESKAQLKQNKPNPFNTSTAIECSLPESVASAIICIYDLQGSQVLRLEIRERGTVNTVIDASSLRPGMYIYSLIADGVEVDSKRMILTD